MAEAKIEVLHTEHREWLNKLAFYRDDLMVLRRRLEEVASQSTMREVMAQVEHFENQIIIQRNEIDEFRHVIKEHENKIVKRIHENSIPISEQRITDHPELRERMERFEQLFQELRVELLVFAAKYL